MLCMMNKLSAATIRQISSGQVISEIHCVVKELVENAIDAKATRIEVALQNFGLDKIEVIDNGSGVSEDDAPFIAQRHYTSKLTTFEDLACVDSYGFRGEGVASICAVADVHIVTKTEADKIARSYVFNHAGEIITKSMVAAKCGTSIIVSRLFANLPVRRHQYRGLRRLQDSLTATEKLLLAFALAHPSVHLSLTHGMERVLSRPACADRQEACRLVLGRQRAEALARLQLSWGEVRVECFVPRRGREEDKRLFGAGARLVFVLINGRPVEMTEFHKLVRHLSREVYNQPNRYPTSVWYLDVPVSNTDINLDPNKRRINFEKKAETLEWLAQEVKDRLNDQPRDSVVSSERMEADPMAWSMGRSGVSQPTEVVPPRVLSDVSHQRPPDVGQTSNVNMVETSPQLPFLSKPDRSVPEFPNLCQDRPRTWLEVPTVTPPRTDRVVDLDAGPTGGKERREAKIVPTTSPAPQAKTGIRDDIFSFSGVGGKTKERKSRDSWEAGTPAKKPRHDSTPARRRSYEESEPEPPAWCDRRKSETVTFDVTALRQRLTDNGPPQASDFGHVIGVLQGYDSCFVRDGSQLVLLNNKRGLEMHEERKLRRDCQLPSMRLPEPVRLQAGEFLTPENVRTLAALATREITDPRTGEKRKVVSEPALLWNGFRVQCLADGGFELRRAPTAFEHSWLPLLSELLSHLALPKPAPSPDWRPLAVEQHFRTEAMRVSRAETTERMNAWQLQERFVGDLWTRGGASRVCWHGKTAWERVWGEDRE